MKRPTYRPTYSLWDVLAASPTEPMAPAKRRHQLTRMYQGLAELETADQPRNEAWRVVSDAVNIMETLADMGQVQDSDGLLHDAVRELAIAGARHLQDGVAIRLSGPGIQAVRAVLEDYAAALDGLPHRVMVEAHRQTERRVQDILRGRTRPGDVVVGV